MDEDVQAFIEEAMNLINEMEGHLLEVEHKKDGWESPIIAAFGFVHTIKGNSLYLDLESVIKACTKAESFLANEGRSPKLPSREEFENLFTFIDLMRSYLFTMSNGGELGEIDGKVIEFVKGEG